MKNRINSIDIIRMMAAFLVICIHCNSFYGKVIIVPIARIAVPIFFMISGFFWTFNKNDKRKNQIRYAITLVLGANGIYFMAKLLIAFFNGEAISMIQNIFSIKTIMKFVFLNESPVGSHLWYLSAFLYCLLIFNFFESVNKLKILYYLIPILLIADLVFGKYSLLIWNKDIPYIYVRNFLFVGMPYFGIGNLLAKNKESVIKINNILLFILVMLFTFTTFLEKYSLIALNACATREHYISTTLLAILLFVLALKYPFDSGNKTICNLALIGRKYTLVIYIIHPLIIGAMRGIVGRTNSLIKTIYYYFMPLIIFLLALICAIIFYYFIDAISKHIAKKNNN